MNYLIVGASGGLGRALCYHFASVGHDLVLVSSDERDLRATASDLTVRFGRRVKTVPAELGGDETYLEDVASAADDLGELDGLLFPVGAVVSEDTGGLGPESTEWLVRTNFLSIVNAVARLLPSMKARAKGVIVGFGSVAGARGRGANVVYAASKRALESYFESLRHSCSDRDLIVQFYVLGYLDTTLASGRTSLLPKASPERLAHRVLRDLHRDVGVVYFPWYWRSLCFALRWTPWFVFKKVRF